MVFEFLDLGVKRHGVGAAGDRHLRFVDLLGNAFDLRFAGVAAGGLFNTYLVYLAGELLREDLEQVWVAARPAGNSESRAGNTSISWKIFSAVSMKAQIPCDVSNSGISGWN
jgi:hypothetical protein